MSKNTRNSAISRVEKFVKFKSTRERKIIHGSNQHHNVSKRKKIFAIQVNQQAYRDKNECKTLITLKETLGPQIAHCESENRNFIEFRDDFLRERQQPRQVIQFGVKSISMSFRRVPRPENTVKKTRFSNDYVISHESCPVNYIQVAYFSKPRSNLRWEYTTQTSHHVQAQVGQSSVFHLTILTPTRNTNHQTSHDTNPWVFFFRLSLLFAFTSMNSESARVAKVLLLPLLQRKIQTVDSEFARHCATSHWSL